MLPELPEPLLVAVREVLANDDEEDYIVIQAVNAEASEGDDAITKDINR